MNELLACPFCGKRPDMEDPDTLYPTCTWWRDEGGIRHYVSHKERMYGDGAVWGMHCPSPAGGCGAEITGDSREESIAKWNRRANAHELTRAEGVGVE